jgi:hypothetical protein
MRAYAAFAMRPATPRNVRYGSLADILKSAPCPLYPQ